MLGKSFQLCFSRLKRNSSSTPEHTLNPHHTPPSSSLPSTSSSSSSSIVFKNFNSLYDPLTATSESDTLFNGSTSASASESETQLDLATAIASRRLFPSAPGPSNSIVDSAAVPIGSSGSASGLAVPTYSPDPYADFRRSMEEMVAALGLGLAGRAELQELLLCYLALNRRHAHKYIVGAFADLLVGLSAASGSKPDKRSPSFEM
ncbi:transcription repressor OFP12-like [Dioscorea cayenensis subsp. rotundata]|uniref:Transcription repressor n=1 Tax=Dioscorea cayennensis subsp. rotundata TaxID=55577 RepID=A0AB40AJ49_DIOCR|nr:transcription repressor OFP12-like [Dioscorea cayenensis subsp. rotundata]